MVIRCSFCCFFFYLLPILFTDFFTPSKLQCKELLSLSRTIVATRSVSVGDHFSEGKLGGCPGRMRDENWMMMMMMMMNDEYDDDVVKDDERANFW